MDEQTALMDHLDPHGGGEQPPGQHPPRWYDRPLSRDPDHHLIGGVIGGVAPRYGFEVRTTRIAVAIVTLVLPVLVLVYLAAWVLLPAHPSEAISLDHLVRDRRRRPLYVAIAIVLLASGVGSLGSWFIFGSVPWGLGLIALGVLLWVTPSLTATRETSASPQQWPAPATTVVSPWPGPTATTTEMPRVPPAPTATERTPAVVRRRRRPIGAISVVVAFVVAAVMSVGDSLNWWNVPIADGLACILAIVAIGALASAVVNATWLPVPVVLVTGSVLTLLLLAAPDLDGGTGTRVVTPTTTADLTQRIHLGTGELTIDLRSLPASETPSPAVVAVDAEVGVGRLHVILPADASVEITTRLGAGELHVDGSTVADGIRHDDHRNLEPLTPPTRQSFRIDARIGLGQIDIDRTSAS